jgi:hypothetical protein
VTQEATYLQCVFTRTPPTETVLSDFCKLIVQVLSKYENPVDLLRLFYRCDKFKCSISRHFQRATNMKVHMPTLTYEVENFSLCFISRTG